MNRSFFKLILCLTAFLFLSMANISAQEKEDDLLRLSVLPLMDKIGTLDYGYLSESISITINDRLKKIFEYRPYKNSKARKYLKKLLKKQKKKWRDIKDSHLLKLTQDKKIDVIIYGEYKGSEFDKNGDITSMLIRVGVFLSVENKTYWIEDEIPLDSSLFDVIEEIADDVVVEISELLSGKSRAEEESSVQSGTPGGKERKALIRWREHKKSGSTKLTTGEINDFLEDQVEDFSDYMEDTHNIKFLSFEDFQDDYIEEDPKSKDANISKKKILRKWMRYFNIPNLVELKVKKEELFITLEAIDQGKRKKKYKLSVKEEKKEKIWSRMARGFRGDIPPEEQVGKKKKVKRKKKKPKRTLTRKNLKERTTIIAPELGLSVGYLYPVLFGDLPLDQFDSSGGFFLEVYYSHPLPDFISFVDDLYLPELYIFAALERYSIDITEGERSLVNAGNRTTTTTRGILGLGLIYAYRFWQVHSLKAGLALGVGNEIITVGDNSDSSILFSANILFAYGYFFKSINFSILSRTSFIPGEELSVLGFNIGLGAGYPLY